MAKRNSGILRSSFLEERFGEWNKFIRDLHLGKPVVKSTKEELLKRFFSKLMIVFIAAFFTTFAFHIFINPNGIYNSGLNGLIQIISKLITYFSSSEQNGIRSWKAYYVIYYGISLIFNIFFVLILKLIYKANLEIIGTSIFYVIFQVIWTLIFNYFDLGKAFSKFNPENWHSLSNDHSQLSIILPYYILVSIFSSIIHSYGYNLIFRAKSTPGGFDIFYTHFSQKGVNKKNKDSIFPSSKILSISTVFIITLFNFFLMNNENFLTIELYRDINKLIEYNLNDSLCTKLKEENKIPSEIISDWKKEMQNANLFEKNGSIEKSFEKRKEWNKITSFFVRKTKDKLIEKYPSGIEYYLSGVSLNSISKMTNDLKLIKEEISSFQNNEALNKEINYEDLKKLISRNEFLEYRISETKREIETNFFQRYLEYICNDEKFWGTIIYIFFHSFILNNIFPREKTIFLQLYSENEEDRNSIIRILEIEKFIPFYSDFYFQNLGKEERIYFVGCYLSKWNYYLISPYFEQFKKKYITEIE